MIEQFFEKTTEALQKIVETQKENIMLAADAVATTIMNDGLIHVFGTGHSHLLALEMYGRAGGLAPLNPILETNLMLHEGVRKSTAMERMTGYAATILANIETSKKDTLIVISQSGRNAVPIEMAMEGRKRGMKTIAVTSLTHAKSVLSRHPGGKRLFEIADIVIDNAGPIGDACLKLDDVITPFGPLSTITGAFILHAVTAEAVEKLHAAGFKPPLFFSGNAPDGEMHNIEMFMKYRYRVKM
ncbi:MAG: SIS domain-containing protein [bacterium]